MVKTIPFYLQGWVEDPFVAGLSTLEVGIYWNLLVYQAQVGYLPSGLPDLVAISGLDLEEFLRYWPKFKDKFEVGADGNLRNHKMAASVRFAEESYKRRELAESKASQKVSSGKKYQPDDPTIQALLDAFPKRPNPREGHTQATAILKLMLRSEADVDHLALAIENYKNYLKMANKGRPKSEIQQYTKKIDKWLEVWQDWLPADKPVQIPKVQPPPSFKTIDEELVWRKNNGEYVSNVPAYPPGARFPWEPRYGAMEHELEAIKRIWTDDAKKLHLVKKGS